MEYNKIASFTFLLFITEGFSLEAHSNSVWRQFNGKHISLIIPTDKYKNLIERPYDEQSDIPLGSGKKNTLTRSKFSLIRQHRLGETSADIGSICNGSIIVCAAGTGTQNYWIDQATQNIQVGDPTSPVYSRRLGVWQVYEAFPLCAWTSTHGTYSPYGGQCYAAVLTNKDKTISFDIILGENKGCKEMETCWAYSLDNIRKMMASIDR